MTFDVDQIVDRRRLRRKLSFWRVVGILALVGAIIGAYGLFIDRDFIPGFNSPQIARVTVSGFIADSRKRDELLEKIGKKSSVKGVIVAIDSPGGASTGGEALYEGLRRLAEKKPTVATIGTVGASAAYMAAIATDHIIARRTSITGSIGVLFQYPEVSELMKTIGVRVEEIKSAPLKAEPSPFKPASPMAKAVIADVVGDTYDWFVEIVAERRELELATAQRLADGRILSGRQALESKLIDEIGGEKQAIAWLAEKHDLDAELPVKDWEVQSSSVGLLSYSDALAIWFAQKTGISPDLLGGGVIDRFFRERLKLDGLISVWQGPLGGGTGPVEGAGQ